MGVCDGARARSCSGPGGWAGVRVGWPDRKQDVNALGVYIFKQPGPENARGVYRGCGLGCDQLCLCGASGMHSLVVTSVGEARGVC